MAFGGVKPIPAREDPVMERFAKLVEDAVIAGDLVGGDSCFLTEQLLYATSIKPLIAAMVGDDRYFDMQVQDEYFEKAWAQFLAGATPRHLRILA